MKKILVLLIILLVLISATNFVVAQNDTDDDQDDEYNEDYENETEEDDNEDEADDDYCELDSDCESDEYCSDENECEDLEEDENESEDEESDEEEYEEVENDEIEDDADEEETEEEASIAGNNLGAQMRLLQLQASIQRNLIRADIVLNYISDKVEDVSELETTLEELESVLDEVKALAAEELEEGAVEEFVALKKESIELTRDFRVNASTFITSDDRKDLADLLKDADYSPVQEIKKEARERAREYNSKRLKEALKNNPRAEEIAEKIRNGELNMEEVKKRVREEVQKLTPEERKKIAKDMKARLDNLREKRAEAAEVLRNTDAQIEQIRDRLRNELGDRIPEPGARNPGNQSETRPPNAGERR